MLSSRYLHLHQALGLGPMWLKRGAKILPAATPNLPANAAPAPERPSENGRSGFGRGQNEHGNEHGASAHSQNGHGGFSDGLNQAAQANAAPPVPNPPAQTAPRGQARHSSAAENARAATMAAVGSSIGGYYKSRERDALRHTPPPKTPAPPAEADTPLSAAEHKAALVGRVAPARVLAVSICPAPEDLAAGHVFSGEDGALLGKMFAAAGLAENEVRRTSWLHSVEFTPAAARLETAAARMQAERELCGAQAVVLLGRFAREPQYAAAIERAFAGTPLFTLPHPARILRLPKLKTEAWEELKRLRDMLQAV